MPLCFFVDPFDGERTTLPEDKTHHVRTVLRMPVGTTITLHDGQNRAAEAKIDAVEKRGVSVVLSTPWRELYTELPRKLTVVQALPKIGEKAEFVVQHGTELGAIGFVFFASVNSARLEGGDRIARKLARWEEMIRNAAEQSGRGTLPTIAWLDSLAEAIALFPESERVCLEQTGAEGLSSMGENADLALFVGPESGFTSDERIAIGGHSVSMGPRVLRTETAALAALAQLGGGF